MERMGVVRRFWEAWKRLGRLIGDFVARIVLTVFYFTVFVPFGLGVRLLRRSDPYGEHAPDLWTERMVERDDLNSLGRLY